MLGEIIAVEHAAAIRNHVAFFDTFAAMGGADQMARVGRRTSRRIAYKDHVHFTDLGYQCWADALSGALLASYDRWRAAQHLPPSRPVAGCAAAAHAMATPPLPGPVGRT